MGPGAGLRWLGRWAGSATGSHWSTPGIGESDAVGSVGVAGDAELAPVVKAMMSATQGQQIGGIGSPAILPVPDMVDLEPPGALAPGDPTPAVTLLDGEAGAVGHDAGLASHAEGCAVDVGLHPGLGVTGHEPAQIVGQGRSQVQVTTSLAVGVGADVDHHQVAVVVGTGDGLGRQ